MDKIPNRSSDVDGDTIYQLTTIPAVDVLSDWYMAKDPCAAIVVPTADNKGNTTHYWISPYNGNSVEFINGIRQVNLQFFMGDNRAHYSDTSIVTGETDRKSTRLNSSHSAKSRMPSSA